MIVSGDNAGSSEVILSPDRDGAMSNGTAWVVLALEQTGLGRTGALFSRRFCRGGTC